MKKAYWLNLPKRMIRILNKYMESKNKIVLMVAYHFPPAAMGSGHLRTLGFVKYLPPLGWEPVVLSAHPRAYTRSDAASKQLIPQACEVHRAFALDTRRHFGIHGKYPAILAQPDRWISWWPAAVYRGLRLIRRYRVSVIWSTYPIMTAHCIAYTLSRLTGLPWIADFRDPVLNSVATQSRLTVSTQLRWEHRVLSRAACSVFTTPGAMRSYSGRYPEAYRKGRMAVITNGYDEEIFSVLPVYRPYQQGQPLHLLHSGLLYPVGRNPIPFFKALANLRGSGYLTANDIKVTLRASGSEGQYEAELERLGLNDLVSLAPPLPYREAMAEQANVDALLLFQGEQYDSQIPAKLYEYLRIGRPIFALVGERGDTAAVLRNTGGAIIVPLGEISVIGRRLMEFIRTLRDGRCPKADEAVVQKYSRRQGALSLAKLFNLAVLQRQIQVAGQEPGEPK
ncbi:MAG: glycosyltransferase [Gammaproteobacteria bacterium]